jgi:hypothetical protein
MKRKPTPISEYTPNAEALATLAYRTYADGKGWFAVVDAIRKATKPRKV